MVVAETQTFLYASRAVSPRKARIFRINNANPLATSLESICSVRAFLASLPSWIRALLVLAVGGSAAFAAALAFGLGCKDIARDAMLRFLRNLREKGRAEKGPDLEG